MKKKKFLEHNETYIGKGCSKHRNNAYEFFQTLRFPCNREYIRSRIGVIE